MAAMYMAHNRALCQTSKFKRAITIAAETYQKDFKLSFMFVQLLPMPYLLLWGCQNSLFVCLVSEWVFSNEEKKKKKLSAKATQNPSFRYFLHPRSMTQSTKSFILSSIPRSVKC